MPLSDRMIWVDIETFGLNVETDPILEVGFKITDLDLNIIDDRQSTIWESPLFDLRHDEMLRKREHDPGEKYVYDMHSKSNLLGEARRVGATISAAEADIVDWLDSHGVGNRSEPLCGSSVHFDRERLDRWMPRVTERFHYRNVDISTLKTLCAAYNPELYEKLPSKNETHRVLPDLDDTIEEFRFYRDNFLFY